MLSPFGIWDCGDRRWVFPPIIENHLQGRYMTITMTDWSQASQPADEGSSSPLAQITECNVESNTAGQDAVKLWHEGMQLADLCYQATQAFPPSQSYGLDAQIRLTASLIPASLAQGYEQAQLAFAEQEHSSYFERAKGALLELKTHLKFSERLSLVTPMVNEMLLEECDVVGQRLQDLCEAA